MNLGRRDVLRYGAALAATGLSMPSEAADRLPAGTMRIICPFPAGDSSDTICRLLGESIRKRATRDVIVENRVGGGGLIAATTLAKSPPDGLTLGMIVTQHITLQTLYHRLELLTQTEPITRLTSGAMAIVVPLSSPYRTIEELFKAMIDKPDRVTYGSGGIGSPAQFSFELLRGRIKGFAPMHVPFKASNESAVAAMSGQIDCAVGVSSTVFPMVLGGKLRALAVTSSARSEVLPDVPTLAEKIAPGFTHTVWSGLAAPKGTPTPLIKSLFELVRSAGLSPELQKFMASSSGTVDLSASPDTFVGEIRAEIEAQTRIVKERNIQVS